MNFIPIDTESFDIITKLWEGRSESDIAKLIDQRFIPLIKKINADPDMKTMFCCSGHIRGEKGYVPNELSSYLVIVARGERLKQLEKMVKENMVYAHRGQIPGWSYCPSTVPLTPWMHGVEGFPQVNCLTIYTYTENQQDPTGLGIMGVWDNLFSKYIFKDEVCLDYMKYLTSSVSVLGKKSNGV